MNLSTCAHDMGFEGAHEHERRNFVVDLMSKQRVNFVIFFIAALVFICCVFLKCQFLHINCNFLNFHVSFIVSWDFYGFILFAKLTFYSAAQ